MEVVKIYINRRANDCESLDKIEEEEHLQIEVIKEEQEKIPTISQGALDPQATGSIAEGIRVLFTAGSLIKITGGAILKIFATSAAKKVKNYVLNLIKSNDRQKGNLFGTKVLIDKVLDNGNIQTYYFICDDIVSSDLENALSQIGERIKNIHTFLDVEYLNELEKLAFKYIEGEWKMLGGQKFESGEVC